MCLDHIFANVVSDRHCGLNNIHQFYIAVHVKCLYILNSRSVCFMYLFPARSDIEVLIGGGFAINDAIHRKFEDEWLTGQQRGSI